MSFSACNILCKALSWLRLCCLYATCICLGNKSYYRIYGINSLVISNRYGC